MAPQAPARGHLAQQRWTLLLKTSCPHRPGTRLVGGARSREGSEPHTGRLGWSRVPGAQKLVPPPTRLGALPSPQVHIQIYPRDSLNLPLMGLSTLQGCDNHRAPGG